MREIAYQGAPLSWSSVAAAELVAATWPREDDDSLYVPALSVDGVVRAMTGQGDYVVMGVLALHNSRGGTVRESSDAIRDNRLRIEASATLDVSHDLYAEEPLERITHVIAHPQATEQCREWLDASLPGRRDVAIDDGAYAVRGEFPPGHAVIAPPLTPPRGVRVLANGIQGRERPNQTTFVLVTAPPGGRRL